MVGSKGDTGIATINVEALKEADEVADLEKAISAIGYGAFNVLLLVAAVPVAWAGIFDTTTTAFLLASAECDLELTYFRKGVLVAIPFVGMSATGFVWDHVTPRVGARNLFVLGLLADSVLNILSSTVHSYYTLLIIKFLSGVLVGGPFSMVMPYLSEFHAARYRGTFARWAGLWLNAGIILPAVAAFAVLPFPLSVDVFDRRYNAWRIYLLICSAVQVVGLVAACTLPQTPKYLVEIGRHEEALKLLRRIYRLNTRKPANTFPIKAFRMRRLPPQQSFLRTISEQKRLFSYNAKLLFSAPYLRAVSFLNFLQFVSMLGFNTMRLWVPHLFIILNNFDVENWSEDRSPTMSEMLDHRLSVPAREYLQCPQLDEICTMWKINGAVYQKSAIIACTTVATSFVSGFIATTRSRKRATLLTAFLLSVVSSFGINWAQATLYMLMLAVVIILMSRVTGNVVTSANVDVIPAPLRSTSLSILTFVGNLGAILGNFIFSALMDTESLIAFMGLGCLSFACFCLSFFQPKPANAPSKNLVRVHPGA